MELYGNHCFGIESSDAASKQKFLTRLDKSSLVALLNFLLSLLPDHLKMLQGKTSS